MGIAHSDKCLGHDLRCDKEAHGVASGVVRTNWCSLWITEGWDWSEPIWDKVEAIRWDIALGTDPDIHNMLILALGIDVC